MGKDKQRTKGGVKPSSSGRTAELLFKSPGSVDATSVFSNFVPVVAFGGQDFDGQGSTLSSELRLLLRKFGKKDATTKIKALGEITEIFNNDSQACAEVLQYWPRIYTKLATDESRKVRELCHTALEAIGKQVGRNLGPHMKSLTPYWFVGQFDIYAPAGSAASKAFKNVFPNDKKQEEVLKFCLDEILALITESLTCTTAQNKAGKQKGEAASNAEDNYGGDSEPYELRMAYASILGLNKLIEFAIVDEVSLMPLIDSDNFWGLTKNSSSAVRRQFFNLVAAIANWKPCLIQRQCIKAITQSLKEETSECLQSLWNCFLTLTLNCQAFAADSNMAKAQILKVCRKGFYGNARSLGPALLPIIAKIGVDEEFVSQILPALQTGYANEKSSSEKIAILRSYAETLAYSLSNCGSASLEKILNNTVFPFTAVVISTASFRDFAYTLGSLIKTEEYFQSLSQWIATDENLFKKNLGHFIVALCYTKELLPQANKSVRFAVDEATVEDCLPAFQDLTTCKKAMVMELSRKSLEVDGLDFFAVLAGAFRSEAFYNAVLSDRTEIIFEYPAFSKSCDFIIKLGVAMDLISTYPDVPAFLSQLSTIFESSVTDSNSLKIFSFALRPHLKTLAVKRWSQQELFAEKVKSVLVNSEELYDNEFFIIKYVLQNRDIFGLQLGKFSCDRLLRRLEICSEVTDLFLNDLLHLVRSTGSLEAEIMKPLVIGFVKAVVRFTAKKIEDTKDQTECLTSEIFRLIPTCGVYNVDVLAIIQEQVDASSTINQINSMVSVTEMLGLPLALATSSPFLLPRLDRTYVEDVLNFTNLSCLRSANALVTASLCYEAKESFRVSYVSRAVYDLKLVLNQPEAAEVELVSPVLKLMYAQAMCLIWKELEKFDMVKTFNEDLIAELKIMNSRLIERLAASRWNRYREEILDQLSKSSRDFLLLSKIPLQLFLESARKLDLELSFVGRTVPLNQFILEDSKALDNESCPEFLDRLISDYFLENQVISTASVIDYLTVQRKNYASRFHFEQLFSHVHQDDKQVLLMLLEVVNRTLKLILDQEDVTDEEFVSSAACWIAGWLKQAKNLPIELDKFTLLWLNKLGRGVSLIAAHARRPGTFASEYVEFHASNLYIPLYYIFLQLTKLDLNNFGICRTTEIIAAALTTIPSPTLLFIEPVAANLCSGFVPLLECSKPGIQVAACRILRKVKASVMTVEGNEEICIIPAELNDLIKKYGEQLTIKEVITLNSHDVLTYLLAWDVLLTMHADRTCNEFGNFAKEPHLLPQFLSVIFFKLLDLVPESKFPLYFDTIPKLSVDNIPPNFGHLVCNVLLKSLQCLPYSARWWWNTQLSKQRDKVMVERFISKYLTSKLITDELGRVEWEDSDKVTVHSHPGCNELIAHYKIEDTTVSITISLPLNHPLGPISVKISDKKLLGKITHLLNNKSNSLAAGLKLWKESMDAKFSGHEECAICFFILHSSTKSLPKMTCRTCNHKFHSACLLKWFSTSNKSECPLCRNLF